MLNQCPVVSLFCSAGLGESVKRTTETPGVRAAKALTSERTQNSAARFVG